MVEHPASEPQPAPQAGDGPGSPGEEGTPTRVDPSWEPPIEIDSSVAHAVRMYDYLLGGGNNFAVDRDAVERAAAAVGGIENARANVRANRAFLRRAVRYLAGEAGIRQFLDIGCGIPDSDNTLAVARQVAPGARVVYVDNDPIVLAHAHALLQGDPRGTAYVDADLRDTRRIIRSAAATLDLDRPVAIVLGAILHVVGDDDDPDGIVARLVDAVPAGSHVAISHLTADIQPETADLVARLNRMARETFVLRDRTRFTRLFNGLELVEPGVVQVDEWRPDADRPSPPDGWVPSLYGAVGRKPPA